jgi:hypothetical protein
MHRTKSILAALAAVALSTTAVFAAASAPPKAADDGLATARAASGKAVLPVRAGRPDATSGTKSPEATEKPEANETPEATKSPKATESPDVDATTGTGAPHPDNHGKTVSEAAHATTPAGFANHGAYVSSIAKLNHGHGKPMATKPVTAHVPTPTPTPTPKPTTH